MIPIRTPRIRTVDTTPPPAKPDRRPRAEPSTTWINPNRPVDRTHPISGNSAHPQFDRVPVSQLDPRIEPVRREAGVRHYDARIGCWIAEPKPAADFACKTGPRYAPIPKTRGRRIFVIYDRETGQPLGRIAADEPSQAQRIAGVWATQSGFTPGDVYVR